MPGLGLAFRASHGAAICFAPSSLSHHTLPRALGSVVDVFGAAVLAKAATISIGKQRVAQMLAEAAENAKNATSVALKGAAPSSHGSSVEVGRTPTATPASPATGFPATAPTAAALELETYPGSQVPAAEAAVAECATPAGASLLQKRPREGVFSPSTSPCCAPRRAPSPAPKKTYPFRLVEPLRSASEVSDQPEMLQAPRQRGPGSRGGAAAGRGAGAAAIAAAAPAPGGSAGASAAGLASARTASAGTVPLEELGLPNGVVQALQRVCQLSNVMVPFVRLAPPAFAIG